MTRFVSNQLFKRLCEAAGTDLELLGYGSELLRGQDVVVREHQFELGFHDGPSMCSIFLQVLPFYDFELTGRFVNSVDASMIDLLPHAGYLHRITVTLVVIDD